MAASRPTKLARVGEVVDWITAAGMFCVVNIHWDGGWIDSSDKERFPKTYATFSAEAERKYASYWTQIASYFAGTERARDLRGAERGNATSKARARAKKAYATLTRVNQLFIDTVRKTGGNNAKRLLIVTGYSTDIDQDHEQRLRAAHGHRAASAADLRALLHAVAVRRHDQG